MKVEKTEEDYDASQQDRIQIKEETATIDVHHLTVF